MLESQFPILDRQIGGRLARRLTAWSARQRNSGCGRTAGRGELELRGEFTTSYANWALPEVDTATASSGFAGDCDERFEASGASEQRFSTLSEVWYNLCASTTVEGTVVDQREKSLERQMRAFHWVRLLADLPGRFAGSREEREAADRIESWLREIGIEQVSVQPVRGRPRTGWLASAHFGLGALACALGGALGAALAGLAAYSLSCQLRARESLFARWLPAANSLNVIGRVGPRAPSQRVVLCAQLDARQPGWIFAEFLAGWNAQRVAQSPMSRPARGPAAVAEILLWSATAVALARWLGASGFWITAAAMSLGVALGVGALVSLRQARSVRAPGANDNASGVAAMLTASEQLLATLPQGVELWVVGSGAGGDACSGMRAFVEEHRDWSRDHTFFIHFRCVGGGALHSIRREGPLGDTAYVSQLSELARRVSASGLFGSVTPVDWPEDTDGGVAARAAFPTLSLISLEADGLPRNKQLASDLPASLEMETVIRAADFGAAVARAALRGEAGPIALL